MKMGTIALVGKDNGPYSYSYTQYLGRVIPFRELTPYSVYSKCPKGDNSLIDHWAINGMEEDRVGIANVLSGRYKNLREGEAIHGNTETGTHIFYKENGDQNITVTKDQNVNIKGNGTINVSGNVTINVTGTTSVTSTGNLSFTAPLTTFNGPVVVNGPFTTIGLTILQGLAWLLHGHSGSPTAPNGPVTPTGGVV